MKRHVKTWVRTLAGPLALLLAFAFATAPASAAEVKAPAPTPAGQVTLAAATAAKLATLDTSAAVSLATTQAASSEADNTGPFLKSPRGLVVLALIAGATAYNFYRRSDKRDEVRSPVR